MSKAEAIQKFTELVEHVSQASLPQILKAAEMEAIKDQGIDHALIKRILQEDHVLLNRLAK